MLQAIFSKFIKIKNVMRIIYFALYQSIYHYWLLVWSGLDANTLKLLQTNQSNNNTNFFE